MSLGPLELGIILFIALLIFGPKRLPGLGKQLGSGMREFKEGITGKDGDDAEAPAEPAAIAAAPQPPAEPAAAPPAEPAAAEAGGAEERAPADG